LWPDNELFGTKVDTEAVVVERTEVKSVLAENFAFVVIVSFSLLVFRFIICATFEMEVDAFHHWKLFPKTILALAVVASIGLMLPCELLFIERLELNSTLKESMQIIEDLVVSEMTSTPFFDEMCVTVNVVVEPVSEQLIFVPLSAAGSLSDGLFVSITSIKVLLILHRCRHCRKEGECPHLLLKARTMFLNYSHAAVHSYSNIDQCSRMKMFATAIDDIHLFIRSSREYSLLEFAIIVTVADEFIVWWGVKRNVRGIAVVQIIKRNTTNSRLQTQEHLRILRSPPLRCLDTMKTLAMEWYSD
jgi:hypothetical protein